MRGRETRRLSHRQEMFLQIENAAACPQPNPQLVRVEGLGQVIVGAGLESLYDIFLLRFGGQQKDVDIGMAGTLAHFPAELKSIHARHHPIQDGQVGRIVSLQRPPGLITVVRDNRLVPPLHQEFLQQMPADWFVFRNQYSHYASSLSSVINSGSSRARSTIRARNCCSSSPRTSCRVSRAGIGAGASTWRRPFFLLLDPPAAPPTGPRTAAANSDRAV